MQYPANLQTVTGTFTAIAAGAPQFAIIVTSPGAGFRYRVWAWEAAMRQSDGGTVLSELWDALLTSNAVIVTTPTNPAQNIEFPGGVRMSEDEEIRVRFVASLNAQEVTHHVQYTIEAV